MFRMGVCRLSCIVIFFTMMQRKLTAQEVSGVYSDLIPQYLLGLVHAPEVHKELKLSDKQVVELAK